MVRKLMKWFRVLLQNISFFLRSLFWRKRSDTLLFGGWFGEKFADNSRYLFQFLSENREKYGVRDIVWITRNKDVCNLVRKMGYQAYTINSKESIEYHKKAKFHIICNSPIDIGSLQSDILGAYSYRSIRINLWHGVAGLKGVNFASNEYLKQRKKRVLILGLHEFLIKHCRIYRLFLVNQGGWGDCYYLGNSSTEIECLQKYFLLPMNRYILSTYPRNLPCPQLTEKERKTMVDISRYKKAILYLPTFRSSVDVSHNDLFSHVVDVLEQFDILWIQKSHSADVSTFADDDNPNLLDLPSDFDINVILPDITAVVTDYSSVWADAMFHRKPVFFYTPDFEEYMSQDRGFVINPYDIMCGPQSFNPSELKSQLCKYIHDFNLAKSDNYEEVRARYWENEKDMGEIWNDILDAIR